MPATLPQSHSNQNIITTIDKLFLLTVEEVAPQEVIINYKNQLVTGLGYKYDFFSDYNKLAKNYDGIEIKWWLRSSHCNDNYNSSNRFHTGHSDGFIGVNTAILTNENRGVAPAFCI